MIQLLTNRHFVLLFGKFKQQVFDVTSLHSNLQEIYLTTSQFQTW